MAFNCPFSDAILQSGSSSHSRDAPYLEYDFLYRFYGVPMGDVTQRLSVFYNHHFYQFREAVDWI